MSEDPFAWYQLVHKYPSQFKKYLKIFADTKQGIFDTLLTTPPPPDEEDLIPCPHCDKLFGSHAMKTHLFSKHGIKNSTRYKIIGSVCLCCLRSMGTRTRLLRHILYRNKSCQNYYNLCVADADKAVFDAAEHDTAEHDKNLRKQGFSIYFSDIPSTTLPGPKGFIREG